MTTRGTPSARPASNVSHGVRQAAEFRTASSAGNGALRDYTWPLALRVAGYASIGAVLLGIVLINGLSDPFRVATRATFCAAFLLAFRTLSYGRHGAPRSGAALLFVVQVACVVVLEHLSRDDIMPTILFLVLAAELQFLLPLRPALVGLAALWLCAIVSDRTTGGPWGPREVALLCVSTFSGFAFSAAITRTMIGAVAQRERLALVLAELDHAHHQLQRHMRQVDELAVLRERARMARDLHDTLGHYLTVITVQLELAQALDEHDPPRHRTAVDKAKTLADECLGEVRRATAALRPQALDAGTLTQAVARLADDLRADADFTVHVEHHGTGALVPRTEDAVYRALQEAMTNVRKHAQARTVWVRTAWTADRFTASVEDDGEGVAPPTTPHTGTGLRAMRERLALVGGALEAGARAGGGFRVGLWVPPASAAVTDAADARVGTPAR